MCVSGWGDRINIPKAGEKNTFLLEQRHFILIYTKFSFVWHKAPKYGVLSGESLVWYKTKCCSGVYKRNGGRQIVFCQSFKWGKGQSACLENQHSKTLFFFIWVFSYYHWLVLITNIKANFFVLNFIKVSGGGCSSLLCKFIVNCPHPYERQDRYLHI